ncbi:hypothetical protein BD311DRAFT_233314 [Dichomitus squalens]|uniref:Uncharacterized protein n=1 Tax=Dichomitus squalens TaxID=114155 RepID=A0A4Q9MSX7_9APHY|nr:hypothetical protein BD311DRAFT_233314 [Dichomitus squalens]
MSELRFYLHDTSILEVNQTGSTVEKRGMYIRHTGTYRDGCGSRLRPTAYVAAVPGRHPPETNKHRRRDELSCNSPGLPASVRRTPGSYFMTAARSGYTDALGCRPSHFFMEHHNRRSVRSAFDGTSADKSLEEVSVLLPRSPTGSRTDANVWADM